LKNEVHIVGAYTTEIVFFTTLGEGGWWRCLITCII